jgi:hypothetical protein
LTSGNAVKGLSRPSGRVRPDPAEDGCPRQIRAKVFAASSQVQATQARLTQLAPLGHPGDVEAISLFEPHVIP